MLTDADVGLLVRIEFWDHGIFTPHVLPCTIVGWITRLTDLEVTMTNWMTSNEPELAEHEQTALIRSAVTRVVRL